MILITRSLPLNQIANQLSVSTLIHLEIQMVKVLGIKPSTSCLVVEHAEHSASEAFK